MSILSKLFGGGTNPATGASPYLNQIPGVGHNTYDEYISQGKTAGQNTQGQYEGMMNDPTGFINKLMEAYKPSEGYQFQQGQLMKQMGNAAAQGGIAGTPMDQMNQAQGTQGLLSQDMQQFLTNALGRYDTGLQGEQGIANRGYDASGKLNDMLGSNLNQQGNLGFQGVQQQNQNQAGLFKALAQALGMLGGGGGLGGLAGLAGGGLSSGMFGGG